MATNPGISVDYLRGRGVRLSSREIHALLNSNEVRAALTVHAERVLSAAQAEAMGYVVTGNYLAGLKIVQETTDRAAVRVKGTAPHSHLVEARHGTLSRALDAAGGS